MTQKIRRLPPSEVQKIAAGEVVERPASVLKELLENSVDAGATAISVFIEQAGKKLIRVVDNGCGMSRADALMAFEAHATSKITSVDELFSVASYGFRGEALCSIAAVSRVTLVTAERGQEEAGTKLVCAAGVYEPVQTVAAQAGCDIAVADLFCSVPVRLKFLKKEETEWNQLYDLIQAVAFSRPEIHFSVYKDGQLVLNAPAVDSVLDRAAQVWELQHAKHLLELSRHEGVECAVSGVISRPLVQRYNRNDILLFVNGRWVKNQHLLKAVVRGYAQALPEGKFPMGVVFVEIAPDRVDVNVHPRKEEVAFVSPGRVETVVVDAIKQALQASVAVPAESVVDTKTFLTDLREKTAQQRTLEQARAFESVRPQQDFAVFPERRVQAPVFFEELLQKAPRLQEPRAEQQKIFEHPEKVEQIATSWRVCGQLFKTYVLLQAGDEFIMMDQHAAHERILYERMKTTFETATSVAFVVPLVVQLTERATQSLLLVQDVLADQGVVFEAFGQDSIRLSSFVVDAKRMDFKDFFLSLAAVVDQDLLSPEVLRKKIYEHVHSHTACKAAIKAGDELTELEMVTLWRDLQTVENRHMCIHGRPTTWRFPKKDIEKHFRRI